MPDKSRDTGQQAVQEQSKAAESAVQEQSKAAERAAERADQAAERAPTLDTDLDEVRKDTSDPTSQRAPARVHAKTNDYAAAINVGRPGRAEQVENELGEEGYSVDSIRLADSASLPQHVAAEEHARSAAERRKVAQERGDFAVVSGRRAPEPVRAARGKKGTGKDPKAIYADQQ
jgi:hypothetical protein